MRWLGYLPINRCANFMLYRQLQWIHHAQNFAINFSILSCLYQWNSLDVSSSRCRIQYGQLERFLWPNYEHLQSFIVFKRTSIESVWEWYVDDKLIFLVNVLPLFQTKNSVHAHGCTFIDKALWSASSSHSFYRSARQWHRVSRRFRDRIEHSQSHCYVSILVTDNWKREWFIGRQVTIGSQILNSYFALHSITKCPTACLDPLVVALRPFARQSNHFQAALEEFVGTKGDLAQFCCTYRSKISWMRKQDCPPGIANRAWYSKYRKIICIIVLMSWRDTQWYSLLTNSDARQSCTIFLRCVSLLLFQCIRMLII